MKKTILSMMLIGCGCALFAQTNGDSTTNSMNHSTSATTDQMSSDNSYNAYGITSVTVPANITYYLVRDYPTAQNVTWQQNGDWYHGTFNNNGRYSHVYYNMAGATYNLALPVTQTYVPDDVLGKVSSLFGPMIYDITTLKGANDQNIYQIRLLENGALKSSWIDDGGNNVMDPYRSAMDMQNSNMNTEGSMNNNQTNMNATQESATDVKVKVEDKEVKIKTENADGTETKVKIENGEVKKKVDD